ncbi:GDSL esterase/lipase [Cinnamomum micranthum f. kanehirae]|uniref:GDSL esterase/lipase n=1 Tax=Cinnamomum micranthum f. kanehirae TaxID=337451 RepID=A0A443PK96_9MAGN|nr:GDSL esterase/lipase [Cinnamomum micranthum f. kanehirae]
MGGEVSTYGDVYSYGILLLEMFTGKIPTDDVFKDNLNLHQLAKMAFPERVIEIIDHRLLLEGNENISSNEDYNEKRSRMHECLLSLVRIGISCSVKAQKERSEMREVMLELQGVRDFYLGVNKYKAKEKKVPLSLEGEMLGLPYLPTFVQSKSNIRAMLSGVNYASAAGGILDETGQHLGRRFSLSQQVMNFESNVNDLRNEMGPNNLTQYLAKSIALMVMGSNDYLMNYLLPYLYISSHNYTPQGYADHLLNHYTRQILALHSVGLRKFFLAGLGPLGCIPYQLALNQTPPGQCVSGVNEIIGLFNVGLKSLVDQLNGNHTGAIFLYGNPSTYGEILSIITATGPAQALQAQFRDMCNPLDYTSRAGSAR